MKKKLLLMMISLTTVSAVGITVYYEVLSGANDNPGGPGGDPGSIVPIDGGIGLLMLAGAAIGAKRLKDQKRKTKN